MNEMSEAFVAYVRFEEKLLLLRRSKSDGDFPALWDGVWGIGDTSEEVPLSSISQANASNTSVWGIIYRREFWFRYSVIVLGFCWWRLLFGC